MTLTGEMGGCRRRRDSDKGTVGSGLVAAASLHSDRVGERPGMGTGFLCIGLDTGEAVGGVGVLVAAAMVFQEVGHASWTRAGLGGDGEGPELLRGKVKEPRPTEGESEGGVLLLQ